MIVVLDSFADVLGDFVSSQALLANQRPLIDILTDGKVVDTIHKDTADHILIQGKLASGAIVSISVRLIQRTWHLKRSKITPLTPLLSPAHPPLTPPLSAQLSRMIHRFLVMASRQRSPTGPFSATLFNQEGGRLHIRSSSHPPPKIKATSLPLLFHTFTLTFLSSLPA